MSDLSNLRGLYEWWAGNFPEERHAHEYVEALEAEVERLSADLAAARARIPDPSDLRTLLDNYLPSRVPVPDRERALVARVRATLEGTE